MILKNNEELLGLPTLNHIMKWQQLRTIWCWRGCRQINGTKWKAKNTNPYENGNLGVTRRFQINGEKSDDSINIVVATDYPFGKREGKI